MLQPAPQVTASVWPVTEDVPELETIIADKAKTIAAQAVLLADYQGVLNAAQNPPPGPAATGTGSASGTSLTVSAVTGTIVTGATITGGGVPVAPPATTVLGQISGTPGGAGVYLTSQSTTATSAALTFTPPPPASTWPIPGDAPTLQQMQVMQAGLIHMQSSLTQQYIDLLNLSETPVPS